MWLHILALPLSSWWTSFHWFRWKYGPPYCKSAMLFYLSMRKKDACNQILNEILHVHFQVWKVRLFDTWRLWGAGWLFPPFLQKYLKLERQDGERWSLGEEVGSEVTRCLIGGSKTQAADFQAFSKDSIIQIIIYSCFCMAEWLCIVHKKGQSHCDAPFGESLFQPQSEYDHFHKRIHLWMGLAQHKQVEV